MLFKAILLFLMLLGTCSYAQVNMHISYDEDKAKYENSVIPDGRYFWGSYDFDNELKPLLPTNVNFTLEVAQADLSDRDWVLQIRYNDNSVKIIGETMLTWPGPHKIGDIFTGSFEMIPLMSGVWCINIAPNNKNKPDIIPPEGLQKQGVEFTWKIDPDGNLLYLGRRNKLKDYTIPLKTWYFTEDSVNMYSALIYSAKLYNYSVKLYPTPKIGDTSVVQIALEENADSPQNCIAKLESRYIDIVSKPKIERDNKAENELIQLSFKFVPKAVNSYHSLGLNITNCSIEDKRSKYPGQNISYKMVFDNAGNLKFINRHSTGIGDITEELPNSFKNESNLTPKEKAGQRIIFDL